MGGSAFASDGLYTPRMSPDVYQNVLQDVLNRLRKIYVHAEAPLEAPGKKDYGDVDILVVYGATQPSSRDVAGLLDAFKFKETKGSSTVNYALPWPESLATCGGGAQPQRDLPGDDNDAFKSQTMKAVQKAKHIQVDVNHNKNIEELVFTKFLHAHGDIWLMIGTMLRPYGLVCTEGGLYIRIPEIDPWDKKQSRVKLVGTPNEILKYLDLDVQSFWTPFASPKDCMDYVATCRFYDPNKGTAKDEDLSTHEVKVEEKKHRQRPMFAEWLDQYLPAHRDAAAGRSIAMTREDVLVEAKEIFGAEFAQRYEQQKHDVMYERDVTAMWAGIRKQIPAKGDSLGHAMRGLKAKIAAPADTGNEDALMQVRQAFREGRFDMVEQWSLANWMVVSSAPEHSGKVHTQDVLQEKSETA